MRITEDQEVDIVINLVNNVLAEFPFLAKNRTENDLALSWLTMFRKLKLDFNSLSFSKALEYRILNNITTWFSIEDIIRVAEKEKPDSICRYCRNSPIKGYYPVVDLESESKFGRTINKLAVCCGSSVNLDPVNDVFQKRELSKPVISLDLQHWEN